MTLRRRLSVRLVAEPETPTLPAGVQRLDVVCNPDGTLRVTADPETLARIAGRSEFGRSEPVRTYLLALIADAWYAADCPQRVAA